MEPIVGRRGIGMRSTELAPTVRLSNQATVLHAKARGHSRNPEAFYEMVESLSPGSKLELFAR